MLNRLLLLGKVVTFLPLSVLCLVVWVPFWLITGNSPFPEWVSKVWVEFHTNSAYD